MNSSVCIPCGVAKATHSPLTSEARSIVEAAARVPPASAALITERTKSSLLRVFAEISAMSMDAISSLPFFTAEQAAVKKSEPLIASEPREVPIASSSVGTSMDDHTDE